MGGVFGPIFRVHPISKACGPATVDVVAPTFHVRCDIKQICEYLVSGFLSTLL